MFSCLLEKKDRTYNNVNLLGESCIRVAVYAEEENVLSEKEIEILNPLILNFV